MKKKRCAACGKSFTVRTQIPNHSYCSALNCQRERRRRWQQNKLQTDSDYRDNQSRAQRAWVNRNPDYWNKYRKSRPAYVERNRNEQRARTKQARNLQVAKMAASSPLQRLPAGVYELRPVEIDGLAKMNTWIVEITMLSATYSRTRPFAKR
jgi:hypothetical protein